MDKSGLSRNERMAVQRHLDFRRALADPRAEFGVPERLLSDPRLDREGKRAILRSWKHDERELAVAEEEGMAGGESSMLHRVVKALDSLSGSPGGKSESTAEPHGRVPDPENGDAEEGAG